MMKAENLPATSIKVQKHMRMLQKRLQGLREISLLEHSISDAEAQTLEQSIRLCKAWLQTIYQAQNNMEVDLQVEGEELRRIPKPSMLFLFRFLLPRRSQARSDVDLVIEDLKEDVTDMTGVGFSKFKIWLVVTWRSLSSITPIVWGGLTRTFLKLTPVALVMKTLSKWYHISQ